MNVLIIGLNYDPEIVGIGPYTAGMARFLAQRGHSVTVVCGKPYYPQWKVDAAFAKGGNQISEEQGVKVIRVPTYVPSEPNGTRRLLHHLSFAARAELAMLKETRSLKPDVVVSIAPSLIAAITARHAARRTGAKLWLHIQDFEVEAAFATGLLRDKGVLAAFARRFEAWALRADRVSTISSQMCLKLIKKGVPRSQIVEFRNWANVDEVVPLTGNSEFRTEWGIDRPHVAIYSGNIANKQGIEIVVEAARSLRYRKDLVFLICGNGPSKSRLKESASELDNIRFYDLQPKERLSELLGLASIHLLPQLAEAADLVLPSKLTNMLASGRPVVATAQPGTGLAQEIEGCGLVSPPGDLQAFVRAIETLLDDPELRDRTGKTARKRAVERWSKPAILNRFEVELRALASPYLTN